MASTSPTVYAGGCQRCGLLGRTLSRKESCCRAATCRRRSLTLPPLPSLYAYLLPRRRRRRVTELPPLVLLCTYRGAPRVWCSRGLLYHSTFFFLVFWKAAFAPEAVAAAERRWQRGYSGAAMAARRWRRGDGGYGGAVMAAR